MKRSEEEKKLLNRNDNVRIVHTLLNTSLSSHVFGVFLCLLKIGDSFGDWVPLKAVGNSAINSYFLFVRVFEFVLLFLFSITVWSWHFSQTNWNVYYLISENEPARVKEMKKWNATNIDLCDWIQLPLQRSRLSSVLFHGNSKIMSISSKNFSNDWFENAIFFSNFLVRQCTNALRFLVEWMHHDMEHWSPIWKLLARWVLTARRSRKILNTYAYVLHFNWHPTLALHSRAHLRTMYMCVCLNIVAVAVALLRWSAVDRVIE